MATRGLAIHQSLAHRLAHPRLPRRILGHRLLLRNTADAYWQRRLYQLWIRSRRAAILRQWRVARDTDTLTARLAATQSPQSNVTAGLLCSWDQGMLKKRCGNASYRPTRRTSDPARWRDAVPSPSL